MNRHERRNVIEASRHLARALDPGNQVPTIPRREPGVRTPPLDPPVLPVIPDEEAIRTPWAQVLWDLQDRPVIADLVPQGGGSNCLDLIGGEMWDGSWDERHPDGPSDSGGRCTLVSCGYREGIHVGTNHPHEAGLPVVIEGGHFVPYYPDPQSKWALRGYLDPETVLRNLSGEEIHKEHFLYLNEYGPLTVQKIFARDCGGQLLQVVNREEPDDFGPHSQENLPWIANSVLRIEGAFSYQNGRDPSRGSFPLTITNLGRKDRQAVIEVSQYACYTRWPEAQLESGHWIRARGGMMIESDGVDYHGIRELHVHDFYLNLEANAQETGRLGGIANGVIENGEIIQENSGKAFEIDKPRDAQYDENNPDEDNPLPALASGLIHWRNIEGNVDVRIGGKYAGHCTEDMVFEDGERVS